MDSRTGEVYKSYEEALARGAKAADVVKIEGESAAVNRVARACKDAFKRRRARQQQQKASRRRNRK